MAEGMKHLWTNGTDTYIAETAQGAMEAWERKTGEVDMSQVWEMIPDDDIFTVYFEDEIKAEYLPVNRAMRELDPNDETLDHAWTHCITARARDWARCDWQEDLLCSTEY